MELKRLLSLVRQAVDDYSLIDNNDKIAVGISGGKDSLTLLYALNELKRFYPNKFDICAVTVDLGFNNLDLTRVQSFCDRINVQYSIVHTQIADIVFNERKEGNPCSLCAKMRKGALNNHILGLDCNKVAYAHHKDDSIETMFMSMIYEGRLHTFPVKTILDKTDLTIIRPLIYVNEADVIGFSNKMDLPICKSPCPMDGNTKRQYVKDLVRQINYDNPGSKERIYTAIKNSDISY